MLNIIKKVWNHFVVSDFFCTFATKSGKYCKNFKGMTKYKPTDKNYKAIGTDGRSYDVIVIDSCEYVKGFNRLAHKGNCRFCKERNENEAGKQIGCSK